MVPTYALHMQKEYYGEDADQFNPDRFFNGQVDPTSMAFHTFGQGPRMCLGMRFALIEMKMVLGNLLREYEFLEDPSYSGFKWHNGGTFLSVVDGRGGLRMRKRGNF